MSDPKLGETPPTEPVESQELLANIREELSQESQQSVEPEKPGLLERMSGSISSLFRRKPAGSPASPAASGETALVSAEPAEDEILLDDEQIAGRLFDQAERESFTPTLPSEEASYSENQLSTWTDKDADPMDAPVTDPTAVQQPGAIVLYEKPAADEDIFIEPTGDDPTGESLEPADLPSSLKKKAPTDRLRNLFRDLRKHVSRDPATTAPLTGLDDNLFPNPTPQSPTTARLSDLDLEEEFIPPTAPQNINTAKLSVFDLDDGVEDNLYSQPLFLDDEEAPDWLPQGAGPQIDERQPDPILPVQPMVTRRLEQAELGDIEDDDVEDDIDTPLTVDEEVEPVDLPAAEQTPLEEPDARQIFDDLSPIEILPDDSSSSPEPDPSDSTRWLEEFVNQQSPELTGRLETLTGEPVPSEQDDEDDPGEDPSSLELEDIPEEVPSSPENGEELVFLPDDEPFLNTEVLETAETGNFIPKVIEPQKASSKPPADSPSTQEPPRPKEAKPGSLRSFFTGILRPSETKKHEPPPAEVMNDQDVTERITRSLGTSDLSRSAPNTPSSSPFLESSHEPIHLGSRSSTSDTDAVDDAVYWTEKKAASLSTSPAADHALLDLPDDDDTLSDRLSTISGNETSLAGDDDYRAFWEGEGIPEKGPVMMAPLVPMDEMRSLILEDYEDTRSPTAALQEIFSEEEVTPARRSWWSSLSRAERLMVVTLVSMVVIVSVTLAALLIRQNQPQLAAPVISRPEGALASGAPVPIGVTLTGGWFFRLERNTIVDGKWKPQSAEWLEGSEIRRVVAIPWNQQTEAVIQTLNTGDEIDLLFDGNSSVKYRVRQIERLAVSDVSIFQDRRPSLAIVLYEEDADERWVVICTAK